MISLKNFLEEEPLSKSNYDSFEKDYQERLYLLFSEAKKQQKGTLLIIEGFAGSGKGALLKVITSRLDPRKVKVHSFYPDHFPDYPLFYQFWQKLPSRGELTIYEGSWYKKLINDHLHGSTSKKKFSLHIDHINETEEMLHQDGYLIFKFFLNIDSKTQEKRFEEAKNKGMKWMVSKYDSIEAKNFKETRELYEICLSKTHFPNREWKILHSKNRYFTRANVMESIIAEMEEKLGFNSLEMMETLKTKDLTA
ncbi:MAG: hypothetical protein SFU98_19650 [Leptospiraceae bacterium]|nr:hypothetical protein [Leptospiraceae bacterium]